MAYQNPAVTVDVVIYTIIGAELKVLLIRRKNPPYQGMWAIPGGFVEIDESLEDAAYRELREETGVESSDLYLEQLYTFGDPQRDPRKRVITVAYFALINAEKITLQAADDAAAVAWFNAAKLPPLAFDHEQIINYAFSRLRYKLEYTAFGFLLLPEKFTLTQLQEAYQMILGELLDKRNFRRKILRSGIIEPTKELKEGGHRPARLYRFASAQLELEKARRRFP